jgi:hypothetical protein
MHFISCRVTFGGLYFVGHCGKSFGTRKLYRCHGLQASWWNGLVRLNSCVCISAAVETDCAARLWDYTSLYTVDDPLDGWLRSVDRINRYTDKNLDFWDVHCLCTVFEHVHYIWRKILARLFVLNPPHMTAWFRTLKLPVWNYLKRFKLKIEICHRNSVYGIDCSIDFTFALSCGHFSNP